jgi:hypothetical protein
MTDQKTEELLKKIEKAGVRKSMKEGHLLDCEDLLAMKVQVMPSLLRITFGFGSLVIGVLSCLQWKWDKPGLALVLALVALFLLGFAIFGIRRTLSSILEGMDAASAGDLMEAAVEGICLAVGGIFE